MARLAVIGALALALGLAACGRKGGLDPPPGALVDPQPATAQTPTTSDALPPPPRGEKKRLPIDILLD